MSRLRWAAGAMRPIKKAKKRVWKAVGQLSEIYVWNRERKRSAAAWKARKERNKNSIWK